MRPSDMSQARQDRYLRLHGREVPEAGKFSEAGRRMGAAGAWGVGDEDRVSVWGDETVLGRVGVTVAPPGACALCPSCVLENG